MAAGPQPLTIDAYHGTPHRFAPSAENPLGEFDSSKIGTGEGNAAYGHGLYLAESPNVAKNYKNTLALGRNQFEIVHRDTEEPISDSTPGYRNVKEFFDAYAHDLRFHDKENRKKRWKETKEMLVNNKIPEALQFAKNQNIDEQSRRFGQEIADKYQEDVKNLDAAHHLIDKVTAKPQGSVYTVRIPDEHIEKMLDWDRPLSEQHPHVQRIVNDVMQSNLWDKDTKKTLKDVDHSNLKGKDFYKWLSFSDELAGQGPIGKAASEELARRGLFGIKYLDQGSRYSNAGTRNFVVFPGNEKHLKILKREADGGAVYKAGGGSVKTADPQKTIRRALMVARSAKADGGSKKASAIHDWNWRPMTDVQNQLGELEEIPSHVINFGKFMDETANKAGTKGLTARDLIKAFTITRASIQRGAVDADKVRAAGLDLHPSISGKVRPEGAFGEWLQTPMGQRYLSHAQNGSVDPKSISNAVQIMAPFGRHTTDIPDALTWAAKNLPGREKDVSSLVASAQQNTSDPSEWRQFINEVRGIGPSKAGFVASLLGRGDQPTLDARQLVLHTGQPSKLAAPYLKRKGGADEAVERLADRQRQMNLSLPSNLSPHYQHLAHHTIWDAVGGDQTTHQDVINAMQHAAHGGQIDSNPLLDHPFVHVMHAAGLPVFEAHENGERDAKGDGGFEVGKQSRPKKIVVTGGEQIRKNPSLEANAPNLSEAGVTAMPLSEMKATHVSKNTLQPWKEITPEQLQREGAMIFPAMGDRTRAGTRLTHVGDTKLSSPVDMQGGGDFTRSEFSEGEDPAAWASEPSAAQKMLTQISQQADEGPAYISHTIMGPHSGDASHMMAQALLRQIPYSKIASDKATEFDEYMRKIAPNWPGILNHKQAEKFLLNRSTPLKTSAAFAKEMDKARWLKSGFPDVGQTRFSIIDPRLLSAPSLSSGFSMARVNPHGQLIENPSFEHFTYSSQLPGRGYAGGTRNVIPARLMYPNWYKKQRPETQAHKGKLQYALTLDVPGQKATQEWLDNIMQDQEVQSSKWGYRRGGSTQTKKRGNINE